MLNRINRLVPNVLKNPSPYNPEQGLNASSDATGADRLGNLSFPTPMLDQYQQMLQQAPNPADYQPSRGRRVLAALAGMGAGASPVGIASGSPIGFRYNPEAGISTQEAILNQPFERAAKRYDVRAGQLAKGADIEEKQLANKRGLLTAEARIEGERTRADIAQQRADVAKQQADTAAQKERDIYETKQKDLQQKLDKANNDLEEKKREADLKQGNASAMLELHRAQLEAQTALHNLQMAQKDRALDESKRLHDMEKENWDKQRSDAEKRISILEEAAKQKGEPQTTTTTESKTPSMFQRILGITPEGKTKITTKTTGTKPTTTKMKSPDGVVKDIPNDQVDHYKSRGAVVVP